MKHHYMSVTAKCPVMMIVRTPWPMPRWRSITAAMTPVMRSHGCLQKDIHALDGLVAEPADRDAGDLAFVERLEAGYDGNYDMVPNFWLYDWSGFKGGSFRLVREARA